MYEEPGKNDGQRILVDRLWPRGLKKEDAHIDEWAKELSPSNSLRKWFNHQPERWPEFKKRYEKELNENDNFDKFLREHKDVHTMTLLFATKDPALSHASILQKLLQELLKI